MIPQMLYQF